MGNRHHNSFLKYFNCFNVLFPFDDILFPSKRQSYYFRTWVIENGNQRQECELTLVTYYKKRAL